MKRSIRKAAFILAFTVMFGIAGSGCSANMNWSEVSTGSVTGSENEDGIENAASRTGSAGGQNSADSLKDAKVSLTMIMCSAGIEIPDNVNVSDNQFINIVKKYANVNLKVEIPPYMDYSKRLQLVLISGDPPDIVHAIITGAGSPTYDAVKKGIFIDLKQYWEKSSIVKKWVSKQAMIVSEKGMNANYYIPGTDIKAPQGHGPMGRYDLIKKYYNGKWPESIEEWIELARIVKQAVPDSIPFSGWTVGPYLFAYGSNAFFTWHGARANGWQVRNGKVVSTFTLPEYREAVMIYRNLYRDGLLDREFTSGDLKRYYNTLDNKNVILMADGADQYGPAEDGKPEWVFAPELKTYPASLKDIKYTYATTAGHLTGHGVYISKTCSYPDRAWRVIEGLCTDELYEAMFWGKEGSEYYIDSQGERVVYPDILNAPQRVWGWVYAFVMGYRSGIEAKKAAQLIKVGQEKYDVFYNNLKIVTGQAEKAGVSAWIGYEGIPEVDKRSGDAAAFISETTAKAITGQIDMDEFDRRVKLWKEKYGFMQDDFTEWITRDRKKLRELGAKEVDW